MAIIEALDHVMIAVRDLEEATQIYADLLGLVATGGGNHPGRGTKNRIIVMDTCYLELIALQHDAPPDHWLAHFLAAGEGLVRVALAVDDLPGLVHDIHEGGGSLTGPHPGQLVAPDGTSRGWQTAFPTTEEFAAWSLPFLIQHDSQGQERRQRLAHPHALAEHPLGARDVSEATIAVSNLTAAASLYERTFGLVPRPGHDDPMLSAHTLPLPLEAARLLLASPLHQGQGPVARGLEVRGDGLYSITLTVSDLPSAVRWLRGRGAHVRVHEPNNILVAAQLDVDQTCGTRIKLVAASSHPTA